MELLSLPNEILAQILEEVGPEDLKRVALSCKTIYGLMKRPLIQHADMKRKYSRIIISDYYSHNFAGHITGSPVQPAFLLRLVLLNDRIAFYPQHLFIGKSTDRLRLGEYEFLPKREFDKEMFADIHDILLKKLHECPYLNDSEARAWGGLIERGCQDAMLAFLMALFPNLRSMRIYPNELSGVSESSFYVHDMVLAIANGFSESEHPLPSPALSKLSYVHMHSSGLDFVDLLPFAALPSMPSISGRGLSCSPLHGTTGIDMSILQSIKLLATRVRSADLVTVLGEVRTLKSFVYQNERSLFQPSTILFALSEHSASTLTNLILINGVDSNLISKITDYYFGTLSGFQTLKEVFVDEKIFFGPISRIIEGEDDAYMASTSKNYKVDRLVDMLPSSIERCSLSGERTGDDDFAALMEGLLELQIDHQLLTGGDSVLKARLPGRENTRLPDTYEIVHFRDRMRLLDEEVVSQPYW